MASSQPPRLNVLKSFSFILIVPEIQEKCQGLFRQNSKRMLRNWLTNFDGGTVELVDFFWPFSFKALSKVRERLSWPQW